MPSCETVLNIFLFPRRDVDGGLGGSVHRRKGYLAVAGGSACLMYLREADEGLMADFMSSAWTRSVGMPNHGCAPIGAWEARFTSAQCCKHVYIAHTHVCSLSTWSCCYVTSLAGYPGHDQGSFKA